MKIKHFETEFGTINIYTKLTDEKGRKVESIEIIPNIFKEGKSVFIDCDEKKLNYLRVRIVEEN